MIGIRSRLAIRVQVLAREFVVAVRLHHDQGLSGNRVEAETAVGIGAVHRPVAAIGIGAGRFAKELVARQRRQAHAGLDAFTRLLIDHATTDHDAATQLDIDLHWTKTVRLDRIFADLFDYLDKRIGLQNVLITLSADHGFMNIPEYSASRNLDAGRIDPDKMIEGTNAALSAKFGDGKYITAWWNPNLYVDYKLIESRKLNKVEVENAAQEFLRDYPGVEVVFTRTQLEQGMMPNTKLARQVILAWHQKISGDIVIMNKPNWYLFAKPNTYASTHGSPWSYDTNVPLAMYGPNWIKPGKYGDSEVVDLGRTIAFLLNVRPPNGCEGRVLSEALN